MRYGRIPGRSRGFQHSTSTNPGHATNRDNVGLYVRSTHRNRTKISRTQSSPSGAPAAEGCRSPRTLGAVTGMTVIAVDDADAHHARSVAAGATIVEEPVDQAYGVREYGARDPEGQLWYFQSPLAEPAD
jgi:uncharacterized glyoxalase superfamily protein PhnB